jgi:hypothetical protein
MGLTPLNAYPRSISEPSWSQVPAHYLLVLCDSVLETTAFDNV